MEHPTTSVRRADSKTCCFMGHRNMPGWVRPALATAVEQHIQIHGVDRFLVGNYGEFDQMVRSVVMDMKRRYPHIQLYLLLAYPPRPGQTANQECVDRLIYPEALRRGPIKAAIPRLNQMMVNASDYVIAYVDHQSNGAYQTMQYAKKRKCSGKIHITNLADLKPIGF